jgi:hypothetical protein
VLCFISIIFSTVLDDCCCDVGGESRDLFLMVKQTQDKGVYNVGICSEI